MLEDLIKKMIKSLQAVILQKEALLATDGNYCFAGHWAYLDFLLPVGFLHPM